MPFETERSRSIEMATLEISEPQLTPGADTRNITTISADVCVYILAFMDFRRDRQTILNCTLVSRDWLKFGRSKLFHEVILGRERSWTLFKVFILSSAQPDITRCLQTVKELDLHPETSRYSSTESWSHEVLVECSQHLTNVKSINLQNIRWTQEWASSLSSIPFHSYQNLQTLRILSVGSLSFADLNRLISAFPTISHLDLRIIEFEDRFKATSKLQELEQRSERHSLTELKIEACPSEIAYFLAKSGLVTHLKKLSLGYDSVVREKHWIALSDTIDSSSLSSVECEFDFREESTKAPFSMSRFACLTSLDLTLVGRMFETQLSWLNQICTSVSSPVLKTLRPRFYPGRHEIPYIFATLAKFRELDTILSSSRFTHLSDVAIRFAFRVEFEELPTTFASLVGTSVDSAVIDALCFHRDDDLPMNAYIIDDDDDLLFLSPSWLKNLFQRRVEEVLPQLHSRGILQIGMFLEFDADDEYD